MKMCGLDLEGVLKCSLLGLEAKRERAREQERQREKIGPGMSFGTSSNKATPSNLPKQFTNWEASTQI